MFIRVSGYTHVWFSHINRGIALLVRQRSYRTIMLVAITSPERNVRRSWCCCYSFRYSICLMSLLIITHMLVYEFDKFICKLSNGNIWVKLMVHNLLFISMPRVCLYLCILTIWNNIFMNFSILPVCTDAPGRFASSRTHLVSSLA